MSVAYVDLNSFNGESRAFTRRSRGDVCVFRSEANLLLHIQAAQSAGNDWKQITSKPGWSGDWHCPPEGKFVIGNIVSGVLFVDTATGPVQLNAGDWFIFADTCPEGRKESDAFLGHRPRTGEEQCSRILVEVEPFDLELVWQI